MLSKYKMLLVNNAGLSDNVNERRCHGAMPELSKLVPR